MRLRTLGGDDQEYADQDAIPDAVRTAFYPDELPYGAELELRPADASAPCLTAVSVTGPFAEPHDPGEFLLALEERGTLYSAAGERRFTREEILGYFLRYLAGDREWLSDFAWAEVVDGKRTGRHRDLDI